MDPTPLTTTLYNAICSDKYLADRENDHEVKELKEKELNISLQNAIFGAPDEPLTESECEEPVGEGAKNTEGVRKRKRRGQ